MRSRLWTHLGLSAVLALAAVPLMAGWVPPNRWYGFRFPGAVISPENWYALNALGGQLFAAAMGICAVAILAIVRFGTPGMQRNLGWIHATLIGLSFWLVTVELVNRLP